MPVIIQTDITDHFTTALQISIHESRKVNDEKQYKNVIIFEKLRNVLNNGHWIIAMILR